MIKKVKITQKHISTGQPTSYSNCPIAKALLDAYQNEHAEEISTRTGVSLIYNDNIQIDELKHSFRIRRFIDKFDDDVTVSPFTAFKVGGWLI